MSIIKKIAKKSKIITKVYSKIRNKKMENVKEIVADYYKDSKGDKIILIGHSGGTGGAETLLKNMIKEFRKQNTNVVVLVRGNGPIIESYKELAPTFIVDTLEKVNKYTKDLKELGYDSAISNTITTGDLIPILHDNDIYSINLIHELPGVIHTLNCEERAKLIGEESDLAVFPSKFVKEKFETIAPIKTKSMIKPQGLYMVYDKFNTKNSKEYIYSKYNIPKENFLVINVGLGEKRKGFDIFFEVANKLKNENISFIWVGTLNDEMKEKYEEKANELNNFIMPGFINDKEIFMKYYDACDTFLLTSREDPFPSVVLEAFNAERPVIAFKDSGGFQDIVRNGISGFLVEPENQDEIIEKIKLLKEDSKLRSKLGKEAKKISKEYSFKDYIKTLKNECSRGVKSAE